MRYADDDGRFFLETLQARAQSRYDAICRSLLPDTNGGMTVDQLQDALFKRMAELPPKEQAELKVKAGIALIELDVMMRELNHHMQELARQVSSTRRKTAVVSAYGKANRMSSGVGSNAW